MHTFQLSFRFFGFFLFLFFYLFIYSFLKTVNALSSTVKTSDFEEAPCQRYETAGSLTQGICWSLSPQKLLVPDTVLLSSVLHFCEKYSLWLSRSIQMLWNPLYLKVYCYSFREEVDKKNRTSLKVIEEISWGKKYQSVNIKQ